MNVDDVVKRIEEWFNRVADTYQELAHVYVHVSTFKLSGQRKELLQLAELLNMLARFHSYTAEQAARLRDTLLKFQ